MKFLVGAVRVPPLRVDFHGKASWGWEGMMDLGQVNRWRDLASKIAMAFCVIALLGLVDGLLVHFREPANLVKVLPGAASTLTGN